MKQRLEATHFIEVWDNLLNIKNGTPRNLSYKDAVEINQLAHDLQLTHKFSGLKTYAIFKIKFHNK